MTQPHHPDTSVADLLEQLADDEKAWLAQQEAHSKHVLGLLHESWERRGRPMLATEVLIRGQLRGWR